MKILVVDNFDSFTYNLVHYLEAFDAEVVVVRIDQISKHNCSIYDKIVISPGPGLPKDLPDLMEFISIYHNKKPILGVCLGMQALAQFFEDEIYNLNKVKHGVSEKIFLNENSLFQGIPSEIEVGLYHSWAIKLKEKSPFIPLAKSSSDVLMAFKHKTLAIWGVQFHPESILTDYGKKMIENFLLE